MVNTWKVSWNKKLYDYNGIIDAFNQIKQDILNQSKGGARMVNLLKIGDYVYVSCNKLNIMKCIYYT